MSAASDLHQISRKEIRCDCGNVIRYEDAQSNCDFPAYMVLTCENCHMRHRTIVDGRLENLTGAF